MNPVSDSSPSSAPAAARAPNARPCSSVIASRIGATTTGRPPSHPAIRGPQRRPASVVAVTSPGASVSLRRSRGIGARRGYVLSAAMASLTPPVDPARDHVSGEGGQVTLVEYGDFECSFCARAYPSVKEVQRRLGDRLRF